MKSENIKIFLLPASSRLGQKVHVELLNWIFIGFTQAVRDPHVRKPESLGQEVASLQPTSTASHLQPWLASKHSWGRVAIPRRQGHGLEFPEAAGCSPRFPAPPSFNPRGKVKSALLTSQSTQTDTNCSQGSPAPSARGQLLP